MNNRQPPEPPRRQVARMATSLDAEPPRADPSHQQPLAACDCRQCIRDRGDVRFGLPREMTEFIVCQRCGNKRCPHATNHRNKCTDSNAPGQPGSEY
jgi:ribosomal protein L40E